MEHNRMAAAALLLVASCTLPDPPIQEIYAEDMPVTFAYGSLAQGNPQYQQVTHPRTGVVIKRMVVESGAEWAIIDVNFIGGGYAYTTQDPRSTVQSMLKPEVRVAWGEQGVVHGSHTVAWWRVTMTDPAASCLAMVRNMGEQVEGSIGRGVQAFISGIYCRDGAETIPAREIPRIASALQIRA